MGQFDYSNTPPQTAAAGYAQTAGAPSNASEAALNPSAVAPQSADPGLSPSAAAPGNVPAGFTQNNGAPQSAAQPGLTVTPAQTGATPYTPAATQQGLPSMPANFSPAFVELTGAGPSLSTLNAAVADIGKILQGTVAGELKSYQVRAGTDAQVLPGIVRPANYDPALNAVVFVQL